MDINHVPGAGSSALLEGRGAFAANRDCWEYALSLGPSGGVLLRAIPESAPAVLAAVPVTVDAARKTIRAVGPPLLAARQSPALGLHPGRFRRQARRIHEEGPAAVRPGGPLGLLAPLEQQQALAAGARLNAVRLPLGQVAGGSHEVVGLLRGRSVGEAPGHRGPVAVGVAHLDLDHVGPGLELDRGEEVAGLVAAHRLAVDQDGKVLGS